MRIIRKFYGLFSLGCVWLSIVPPSFGDFVFTESDDDRIVSGEVGEKISFNLSGNPSTGYSWVLASTNGNAVIFTGESSYIPDNPDLPGGVGIYQYPLLAIHAGTSYFEFQYRKAWDDQSILKYFTITLNVSDATPRLMIKRAESSLVLSWPIADSEGYYLEGTPSLVAPQWQALNALVRSDGTNYWVEVQPTGNATYYRLRK